MPIQNFSNQRTIASEVSFGGKALQAGGEAAVRLVPAGPNTGIVFKRTDLPGSGDIKISGASLAGSLHRRTAIGNRKAKVETVEHFLAALWCLGIDNIAVELNGPELPALDGSAKAFLAELKKAGVRELDSPGRIIKVEEPIEVKDKGRFLGIYPADGFSVSYLIDYPVRSIGRELFSIELNGMSFEKDIAPARTFCLRKEVELLLRLGFGKGATFDNNLVMDEDGPVGTVLRYPNEPLRHKILDLVGDLYTLGMPVLGKVVAEKSGHGLNAKLVGELYKRYVRPEEERKKEKGKRKKNIFFAGILHPLSLILNKRKGE